MILCFFPGILIVLSSDSQEMVSSDFACCSVSSVDPILRSPSSIPPLSSLFSRICLILSPSLGTLWLCQLSPPVLPVCSPPRISAVFPECPEPVLSISSFLLEVCHLLLESSWIQLCLI
ncbi:hypothetical protein BY996DRAFT_6895045 [Phakopsora pachyrhizi]|nr:hypothetical protein BY996DRAFT_6895045 [Phakopsora pachyrhizi]